MGIEHKFLFFPERHIYYTPKEFGLKYEDVFYITRDGMKINAWLIEADKGSPIILWCHGNAGNISHRLENIAHLVRRGLSVFIFDYRGFGKSEGKITEEGLYLDALGGYEYLRDEKEIPITRIVPFGRSMGGPVAVDLAVRVADEGREQEGQGTTNFPCLILESTFTSLSDTVKKLYPGMGLNRLLRMKFDAGEKIQRLTIPVLIIHGDHDDIIDYSLGEDLYEIASEPKTFYAIKGALHNDTYEVGGEEYFNTFVGFAKNPGA